MPIEKRTFPPESFLKAAAAAVVEENGKADLSGITVLLPNLHVAPEFALELRRASEFPCVLLPQLTTLSGLVPPLEYSPASVRAARLYLALKEKNWFARENDLWHLSREFIRLFDELTLWNVPLPASQGEFSAMLAAAYQAREGEPLMFEARLIFELWHAMEIDCRSEAAAYQLQLASLAEKASNPLYVLALDDFIPAEESFFRSWSEKAPVRIYSEGRAGFYGRVWTEDKRPIRERAEACGKVFEPVSNLRLFCAGSLEEEAEAAQIKVRQWLIEGSRKIALVALDRLAARRTRALLERAEILVSDETGWTFSTTSASTVLVRLLDSMAADFYHEDMLDLLKSPFIFSDWPVESKRKAVHFLEQAIRKNNIVSGLDHYSRLELEPEAVNALAALKEAAQCLSRRSMTLSEWLSALFESLERLGIMAGLRADMAGESLLDALFLLENELSREQGQFGFGAFRRWLDMQFESMTFRDTGIKSPVVFTHLGATRARSFDAVVLLGCDAAHLPSEADAGLFFNQAVRAQLKLPLKEDERRRQVEALSGLLCRSKETWASWQSLKNGEANLLSPCLDALNAFHLHAFGMDLIDGHFSKYIPMLRLEKNRTEIGPTFRPAPAIPEQLVPESISASGYNSLLACPYQYYAKAILSLSPLEEAEKVLEKADYGSYLHKILYLFHSRYPSISDLHDAEEELWKLSEDVFRDAVEADYLSHGWALRWRRMIPLYLEWQKEREEAEWKIERMEEGMKREFALECGKKLKLVGRIDRIDSSNSGISVIDYKTQNAGILKEKLIEPGEDVQLAVYALLLQEPVHEVAYLSLDGQVGAVSPEAIMMQEVGDRLLRIFEAIHEGANLPAQGIEAECSRCDMRGLCRKDYWA